MSVQCASDTGNTTVAAYVRNLNKPFLPGLLARRLLASRLLARGAELAAAHIIQCQYLQERFYVAIYEYTCIVPVC